MVMMIVMMMMMVACVHWDGNSVEGSGTETATAEAEKGSYS